MLKILDAFSDRATYTPRARAVIHIHVENAHARAFRGTLSVELVTLGEICARAQETISLCAHARQEFALELVLPSHDLRGYGVEISVRDVRGQFVANATTALDVCADWRLAPRYGFLADFFPKESDTRERLATMARYHLNAIQFYDWMYRHDTLIPPTEHFLDALHRALSLQTVREKIRYAHAFGMQALAYTAVYAASPAFWSSHRKWGLYDADGAPSMLGDFLNIMNLADARWAQHFRNECVRAIRELDFDGIHLDQYGYPRVGYDARGNFVSVELALAPFLDGVSKAIDARPTVFNAVNTWGLDPAAQSRVAPLYIEVWSPHDTYRDVREIILCARNMRNGRAPILAAYVDAFQSKDEKIARGAVNALRVLTAAIYLNGGSHIVMGERNGVLCDPYFPEYAQLDERIVRALRRDYDFISRYAEYFFDPHWRDVSTTYAGGINQEVKLQTARYGPSAQEASIWTIVREREDELTVGLMNLYGNDAQWNQPKQAPRRINRLRVQLNIARKIRAAFYASPDVASGRAQRLDLERSGKVTVLTIPSLTVWGLLIVQYE